MLAFRRRRPKTFDKLPKLVPWAHRHFSHTWGVANRLRATIWFGIETIKLLLPRVRPWVAAPQHQRAAQRHSLVRFFFLRPCSPRPRIELGGCATY